MSLLPSLMNGDTQSPQPEAGLNSDTGLEVNFLNQNRPLFTIPEDPEGVVVDNAVVENNDSHSDLSSNNTTPRARANLRHLHATVSDPGENDESPLAARGSIQTAPLTNGILSPERDQTTQSQQQGIQITFRNGRVLNLPHGAPLGSSTATEGTGGPVSLPSGTASSTLQNDISDLPNGILVNGLGPTDTSLAGSPTEISRIRQEAREFARTQGNSNMVNGYGPSHLLNDDFHNALVESLNRVRTSSTPTSRAHSAPAPPQTPVNQYAATVQPGSAETASSATSSNRSAGTAASSPPNEQEIPIMNGLNANVPHPTAAENAGPVPNIPERAFIYPFDENDPLSRAMREALQLMCLAEHDIDVIDNPEPLHRGSENARHARLALRVAQEDMINTFTALRQELDLERNLHNNARDGYLNYANINRLLVRTLDDEFIRSEVTTRLNSDLRRNNTELLENYRRLHADTINSYNSIMGLRREVISRIDRHEELLESIRTGFDSHSTEANHDSN